MPPCGIFIYLAPLTTLHVCCVVLYLSVQKLGRCVLPRAGCNGGARVRALQTSNPTPCLRWTAHWVGEKTMRRRADAANCLGWVDARQRGHWRSSLLLCAHPACRACFSSSRVFRVQMSRLMLTDLDSEKSSLLKPACPTSTNKRDHPVEEDVQPKKIRSFSRDPKHYIKESRFKEKWAKHPPNNPSSKMLANGWVFRKEMCYETCSV